MGIERSHIPLRVSLKSVPRFCVPLLLRDLIMTCFITKSIERQSSQFSILHVK